MSDVPASNEEYPMYNLATSMNNENIRRSALLMTLADLTQHSYYETAKSFYAWRERKKEMLDFDGDMVICMERARRGACMPWEE